MRKINPILQTGDDCQGMIDAARIYGKVEAAALIDKHGGRGRFG